MEGCRALGQRSCHPRRVSCPSCPRPGLTTAGLSAGLGGWSSCRHYHLGSSIRNPRTALCRCLPDPTRRSQQHSEALSRSAGDSSCMIGRLPCPLIRRCTVVG
ncbi:hypothetical protein BJX96DRAFT_129991 [Aspergillus floccosus]